MAALAISARAIARIRAGMATVAGVRTGTVVQMVAAETAGVMAVAGIRAGPFKLYAPLSR